MTKSISELSAELAKLYQHLSDSLDNGLITGDHYDNAQTIISEAYPAETREINIREGELEADSDPNDIGGTPPVDLLFDAVENKEVFINDFRKAIQSCKNYNIGEVVAEIIASR